MATLRIGYKDDGVEVVRKVNAMLKPFGVEFLGDGGPHDGFCVYELHFCPNANVAKHATDAERARCLKIVEEHFGDLDAYGMKADFDEALTKIREGK